MVPSSSNFSCLSSEWARQLLQNFYLAIREELMDLGNVLDTLQVRACLIPREIESCLVDWFRGLYFFIEDVWDIECSTIFPLVDLDSSPMEERIRVVNARNNLSAMRKNLKVILNSLADATENIRSTSLREQILEIRSLVKKFAERLTTYFQEILLVYPTLLDRAVSTPKAQEEVDNLVVRRLIERSNPSHGRYSLAIFCRCMTEEALKTWKRKLDPGQKFALFKITFAHNRSRQADLDRLLTFYF